MGEPGGAIVKVSIITVYYNRENYVQESLQSLLNQTYRDMEIIAVDDGSTDSTYQKLMSFSEPRLTVYTHANQGFVKSIREAIERSTGELIAIHGSGDISLPERIRKQAQILEENGHIGVVGCYIDECNVTTGHKKQRRSVIKKDVNLTDQVILHNPFTQGEVMFRREVYNRVGGYREFFKYGQDRDLWLRMSLVTEFYIIPEVLYRRFNLPGGVSQSIDKIIMQKYFASTACQCIQMKRKGQSDLVEQYGMYASFFRKRDKSLCRNLFLLSIYAWMYEDTEKAIYVNQLSMEEKWTIWNIIQRGMLSFAYRFSGAECLMKKMLRILGYGKRSVL